MLHSHPPVSASKSADRSPFCGRVGSAALWCAVVPHPAQCLIRPVSWQAALPALPARYPVRRAAPGLVPCRFAHRVSARGTRLQTRRNLAPSVCSARGATPSGVLMLLGRLGARPAPPRPHAVSRPVYVLFGGSLPRSRQIATLPVARGAVRCARALCGGRASLVPAGCQRCSLAGRASLAAQPPANGAMVPSFILVLALQCGRCPSPAGNLSQTGRQPLTQAVRWAGGAGRTAVSAVVAAAAPACFARIRPDARRASS